MRLGFLNYFSVAVGLWKLHLFVTPWPVGYRWWDWWIQQRCGDQHSDCWALSSDLWIQLHHLLDYYMHHAQFWQFWQNWQHFSELQVTAYKTQPAKQYFSTC